jgi:hypothetical protein
VRRRRGSILKATTGVLLVLVPLALEVAGCRPVEWAELGSGSNREEPRLESRSESRPSRRQQSQSTSGLRIVARSGREVVRLTPNDVVRIMQRVGFSDDQILELGTDLHNALLLSGAAEVIYGKRTEMIFLVSNRQVQIQSHSRGTFVYDVLMQQFILGSARGRRR